MVKPITCILAAAVCVAPAIATPVEFSAVMGDRAAWVSFETQGDNLVVTLANTSEYDVLVPANVLTAVFFNSSVSLALRPASAVVPAGSGVLFDKAGPGGAVGGEWSYAHGLTGAPGGRAYGISSTGLGLFGLQNLFGGKNLQGPTSPGGLEYGITSMADDPSTGNTPVTGQNALIRDRVVFTFSGLPAGFDPGLHIRDVFFQYGTSLSEGGITNIPEPRMLVLFAAGGLLFMKRKMN